MCNKPLIRTMKRLWNVRLSMSTILGQVQVKRNTEVLE